VLIALIFLVLLFSLIFVLYATEQIEINIIVYMLLTICHEKKSIVTIKRFTYIYIQSIRVRTTLQCNVHFMSMIDSRKRSAPAVGTYTWYVQKVCMNDSCWFFKHWCRSLCVTTACHISKYGRLPVRFLVVYWVGCFMITCSPFHTFATLLR